MITASKLTKRFGDFYALNNLNCTIPEGCIYKLGGNIVPKSFNI